MKEVRRTCRGRHALLDINGCPNIPKPLEIGDALGLVRENARRPVLTCGHAAGRSPADPPSRNRRLRCPTAGCPGARDPVWNGRSVLVRTNLVRLRSTTAVALTMSSCTGGDTSGIGAFDRTFTTKLAVLASVDEDGQLTIQSERTIDTPAVETALAEPGDPTILRDPFDYRPDAGVAYFMLLAPAVEAFRDPQLGDDQYSLLYLHDLDSDSPADSFPTRRTESGKSPVEFLDCLQEVTNENSRTDALVAAIDGKPTLSSTVPNARASAYRHLVDGRLPEQFGTYAIVDLLQIARRTGGCENVPSSFA